MRISTFNNCFVVIIACVVQSCTVFIIQQKDNGLNKEEFRSSNHGRFGRKACHVKLYYDVKCHGNCPPYDEDWVINEKYMNCTDGLTYHCAKDNKTGEYEEACAEAIRCERGKEPRLIFPPGHNKTARVICRYCEDEKYYNPKELMLSNTYYRCKEYKYPCSMFYGQVECDEHGIERYWTKNKCRCDASKNFVEESAVCPTVSPCKDSANLICQNHDCGETLKGYRQDLREDYCCTPVVSSHNTSSVYMNVTHLQTNTTEETTSMTVSTPKTNSSAIKDIPTQWNVTDSNIEPKETTKPTLVSEESSQSDEMNNNMVALIVVSVVLGVVVVIGVSICVFKIHKHLKSREKVKKTQEGSVNSGTSCINGIENILPEQELLLPVDNENNDVRIIDQQVTTTNRQNKDINASMEQDQRVSTTKRQNEDINASMEQDQRLTTTHRQNEDKNASIKQGTQTEVSNENVGSDDDQDKKSNGQNGTDSPVTDKGRKLASPTPNDAPDEGSSTKLNELDPDDLDILAEEKRLKILEEKKEKLSRKNVIREQQNQVNAEIEKLERQLHQTTPVSTKLYVTEEPFLQELERQLHQTTPVSTQSHVTEEPFPQGEISLKSKSVKKKERKEKDVKGVITTEV